MERIISKEIDGIERKVSIYRHPLVGSARSSEPRRLKTGPEAGPAKTHVPTMPRKMHRSAQWRALFPLKESSVATEFLHFWRGEYLRPWILKPPPPPPIRFNPPYQRDKLFDWNINIPFLYSRPTRRWVASDEYRNFTRISCTKNSTPTI